MKNKFLALTLCLAAVSFAQAQEMKVKPYLYSQDAKILSKASASLPLFKAVGNHPQAIVGAVSPTFLPLTFTEHKFSLGDAIKPKRNGFAFVLEEGTYQIGITGTFQAIAGEISLIDIGLQVGSRVIAVNSNAIESGFDNFQILTTSQLIHLEKKKTVCWVARNRANGTTTNALHRSISILKVD